jgi:hypothetical protein
MALSFSTIIAEIEAAAAKAEMGVDHALIFLAHLTTLVPTLTAVADVAEATTGNAELIPLTNTVGAAVEASGKVIIANQNASAVQQLSGLAQSVEVSTGNADLVETTAKVSTVVESVAKTADQALQAVASAPVSSS